MKKKSLWRAKMMARMAQDGDVEGLAEIITELMGEEEPPVEVNVPEDQPVVVDCGPQILEALNQIIALLSAPAADACGTDPQQDEDVEETAAVEAVAEAVTEAAAENMAETVAEAVAEAVEAMDPVVPAEDPVEALVAEILEPDTDENEEAEVMSIVSGILEPEDPESDECLDPDARTADALRAALASFRPQLQRMTPDERQRFNADVAARMKKLTRKPAGKPNAYAALRQAASRDRAAQTLGQKIMASRNANYRK